MNPEKKKTIKYSDYMKKWEKRFVGSKFGDGYGGIYRNQRWINMIVAPVFNTIKKSLLNKKQVFLADFGSGSGIVGLHLLKKALMFSDKVFLYSIDVYKKQLNGLIDEAKKLGIKDHYQSISSNVFDIPYPNEFFNGTIARLLAHHLTELDNKRLFKFIISKLKEEGVAVIYDIVAPNDEIRKFIKKVYEWRVEKMGVNQKGYISTRDEINDKLYKLKGISYKIIKDSRGPLFVSGIASIQEKTGLSSVTMKELENIFKSANFRIKDICKIKMVKNKSISGGLRINTYKFYWPCQLIIIKKINEKK